MKRITKIGANETLIQKKKLKVAAYCRVSTASDEQLISLDAQKAHYESYIRSNDEWEYVGLYYDEGITGTKKDVRAGLLSMIADCEDGKIEFIITKSISRFARNTTDCLEMVRKLTDLGISIFFEKENINTGSMESELMLSILSSLAESESVSISENSKWSVQRRFQNGTFIIAYPPYGYDNDNGTMVIVPEQAEVVKEIFAACLAGKGTHAIAKELNARGLKTKKNGKWGAGAINAILTNEKYTGDVIFQKTYSDSSFNRHINYGEPDTPMSRLSAMRILTGFVQFLTKGRWKKATALIPTDTRTDIVSPAKSSVESVVPLSSVGSITNQVEIMWLGLVERTWKAKRIVLCSTFPMRALNWLSLL